MKTAAKSLENTVVGKGVVVGHVLGTCLAFMYIYSLGSFAPFSSL
jgi:hypothetical protein